MGSIDQVNSSVFPLNSNDTFLGESSSTTNFTEICISIDTDTKFQLNLYFSSDGVNLGKTTTFNQILAPTEAQIYNIPPYMRFVKIELVNNDTINQSYLRLMTILKTNITYTGTNSSPSANVNIAGVSTGDSLNVNVQNYPFNQDVSDADTHTKLDTVITDLNKLTYDVTSNLNVNLNNLNSNFIDTNNNDGFKVAVQNSLIDVSGSVSVSNFPATQAVSNGSLSSMSFDTNRLNVFDTDANTKLTNIYNIVNSRGQAQMINGSTITAIELPNVKSCTIYGNVAGATILTLKFSADGTTFYNSQYSINMTGAGDFGFVISGLCAKWIMFNNSNSVSADAFVDYC
jgi:hypothetical protein